MRTDLAVAKGQANRNKPLMVFDWEKAAKLICEKQPMTAGAGLQNDWEWTGGTIWANNAPVPQDETYTYLASTWAVPELDLDGELIPCYKMEDDTKWDEHTYWPDEALSIVEKVQAD